MKKKILIVDDDEEICEEFSEILRGEHYLVETAYDGLKAGLMIGKGGYDLIILDLKLPGLSGFELLKMIRENKILSRVLILTGRPLLNKKALKELPGTNKEEEKILKLADGIVNKPFDIKYLLNKIKELIS
ncbi:MAG: response regulator [Candidatus Omnitrophica bacterium]|nr:response regulator [Candidatus Omnitrophota bacterium]